MPSIALLTENDVIKQQVEPQLFAAGFAVQNCLSSGDALLKLSQPGTRLLLVDGDVEEMDGELLSRAARVLPHEPSVRLIHGFCKHLRRVEYGDPLIRLARRLAMPELSGEERQLIELQGISNEPMQTLKHLAQNPLPIRLMGEPGTGKEQVARYIHRLSAMEGPFVRVRPGQKTELSEDLPGTLFLEAVHRHTDIIALLQLAPVKGWRVIGSSRRPPDAEREGMAWTHLVLKPLRERPRDIQPLARLYLRRYRRKLGLPPRRVSKAMWQQIEAHTWPGNHRELESFVVQASTNAVGTSISPTSLPRHVLERLTPEGHQSEQTLAFERVVEDRLRPVVAQFEAGDSGTLHRMVVDATERALFRLVLGRTGGNQKAAAEMLGLARNTLRAKISRLDPFEEGL